ncbi:MAG: hypothetical protein IID44_18000 [Planctomycetes bacterium]|nr:hypothetical protein [Planctomycetota bacterium]
MLTRFSDQVLAAVQSEPKIGRALHKLLVKVGEFMTHRLYNMPLTTDQISSIEIDHQIDDAEWGLIRRAVAIGLLYPNINPNNPDELPDREGTFHLAYALAPHFRILPRRGKSRILSAILRFAETGADDETDAAGPEDHQRLLFDDKEGGQ